MQFLDHQNSQKALQILFLGMILRNLNSRIFRFRKITQLLKIRYIKSESLIKMANSLSQFYLLVIILPRLSYPILIKVYSFIFLINNYNSFSIRRSYRTTARNFYSSHKKYQRGYITKNFLGTFSFIIIFK